MTADQIPYPGPAEPAAPLPGGTQPAYPGAPAPVPGPVPGGRRTSGMAVASLVLGIAAFIPVIPLLPAIPAIVAGHVARRTIRRTGQPGEGLALAGLVLGYLSIALFVLVMAAWAAIGDG